MVGFLRRKISHSSSTLYQLSILSGMHLAMKLLNGYVVVGGDFCRVHERALCNGVNYVKLIDLK